LEDIKRVILTRFGILPEDIENRLSKIEDLEKLNVIFDKSIIAKDIDEIKNLIYELSEEQ
ncbi:MAG: flagellar biosynthesis/type III secretory pathway protein, partial [Hydrogenobaculum sp.]